MTTVNLEVVKSTCPYNQNGQTADIQFSLLNRIDDNSFKELHYHVKCREYFGDALLAAYFDKDLPNIYGYSLKNKRMSLDETLFSVTIPNNTTAEKLSFVSFLNGVTIIRSLEKKMGIKLKDRSEYFLTNEDLNGGQKLVIVGPKEWLHSPLLISLYTFVLRLTTYSVSNKATTLDKYMKEVASNYSGTDVNYINNISGLDVTFLLKNYKEVLGTDPLTGLSDEQVGVLGLDPDGNDGDLIEFTYDASEYGLSKEEKGIWGLNNNHDRHGIVTFSSALEEIGTSEPWCLKPKLMNFKWVMNYSKLFKIASEDQG